MRKKVTVVGSGYVGSTTALRIAEAELADVAMVDIKENVSEGLALDIFEASPVNGSDAKMHGATNYDGVAGSDVIVITAGIARKPGMSRDDLVGINAGIIKEVVEKVTAKSPDAILIMVSNPLDVMTMVAAAVSKFPAHRIMGMAGVLDTARFRSFIAMELNVSVENVTALVLGGHGDDMVPMVRYANVAGIPLTELLSKDKIDALVKRAQNGGAEIVNLLKTGSAYYAPSISIFEMVEAILKDKHKILPVCVNPEGKYGITGAFAGLPVKLGARGVEEIIELKLSDEELKLLQASASHVKETFSKLKL